jgi:transcriptional regulator with XRE-family HTH domain
MRVTRGITRSQLAILANVSDTTIMRIEQDRKMTLDSYVAVWAALDPDAIATVGEFASFAEELKA